MEHFQSTDVKSGFFLLDFDVQFIYFANILFMAKIEQAVLLPSNRKSRICYRILSLGVLCIVTSYFLKVTKFEMENGES